MPGGDGTGPVGMGPMTGRGVGYCAGYPTPGYMIGGVGRGFWGRGRGGGWGRRNWFRATGLPFWARFGGYTPLQQQSNQELEKQALQVRADMLQSELDLVNRRIREIETTGEVK